MCEFSEALIEQGEWKKSIEIAQNLLAMHTPIEVVVKVTQLPQREVELLAEEISCKVE